MESKSEQSRRALANGDPLGALRIASRFHDRSCSTMIFKRGFDAHNHPDFYRQIGKSPEQLMAAAITLLEMKFRPGWSDRNKDDGTGICSEPCPDQHMRRVRSQHSEQDKNDSFTGDS